MNPNDAIASLFLSLVQISAVIIVLTQAVQNVKYLTLNFGKWTIVNTVVSLATAFIWDLRLIEGLTMSESSVGHWADNVITGWVMSGGISSVYNMAKKAIQTKNQLNNIKVETEQAKADKSKMDVLS